MRENLQIYKEKEDRIQGSTILISFKHTFQPLQAYISYDIDPVT